jgi:enoyl-CoA hydratase/carnithine racemase
MLEGTVSLTFEDHIARMRIENPPLNILTNSVRGKMLEYVYFLEQRPDVRVVIVEGAGDHSFSVGSHVREFPETEAGGIGKIRFEQHLLNRLAALQQVTIACLRGHVLGGGAELMLACHLRLAADTAEIGFPEIRLAALPAAGGMKRLCREIGPARAREMILTGKPISARKALEFGLINAVFPSTELADAVAETAALLAGSASDALRLANRCIQAATEQFAMDTIEAESFAELYRGANLREGLTAFLEKREPRFG